MAGRPRTRRNRAEGRTCGARTRQGTPCKRMRLWPNGRCLNHGGPSRGPTSPEGRKRALEALQCGWKRWNERRKDRL